MQFTVHKIANGSGQNTNIYNNIKNNNKISNINNIVPIQCKIITERIIIFLIIKRQKLKIK